MTMDSATNSARRHFYKPKQIDPGYRWMIQAMKDPDVLPPPEPTTPSKLEDADLLKTLEHCLGCLRTVLRVSQHPEIRKSIATFVPGYT
eukprot:jgi/Psemu1/42701/gm1.42701_g